MMNTNKIEKRGSEWCAVSEDGSRSFGCYATEGEAKKRLGQVEYFKQENTVNKNLQLINNAITSDMVRMEEYQDDMHYMIKSATMPDDIVMNGILYPAEETAKSFMGLNGVHAPLGHPQSGDGEYISATDPEAITKYWVGGQVINVRRENGRVLHDTAINISEAKKTDRGKRVLDRVEALMNGDNAKPIHTSTGVYLDRQDLDAPMTNAMGQEYSAIAYNFFFDHNAILLDEEGAATPEQGTGMAVNKNVFVHNLSNEPEHKENEIVFHYAGNDKKSFLKKISTFMKSMGFASNNHDAYNGDTNNQTPLEENDMSPEELKAALAEHGTTMQANFSQSLADAVKPLQDKIEVLEANAKAGEKAEKETLIAKSGLPEDVAKTMDVNALKAVIEQKESLETGEYGERVGSDLQGNKKDKKDDEWEGYDLNANMEAK